MLKVQWHLCILRGGKKKKKKRSDDDLSVSIKQREEEIMKPADRKQPVRGRLKQQVVYGDCRLGDGCY